MDFLHFDVTDDKERLRALWDLTSAGWTAEDVARFLELEQTDRKAPQLMNNQTAQELWVFRRRYASMLPAAHV